jgi:hypothetical protein
VIEAVSLVNWNAIIQGVATGVVAAALLALFALLRYRARDIIFRWRLRRELRFFFLGWNTQGVTIGIRNRLGKSFTVRRLVVTTNRGNFRSSPTVRCIRVQKKKSPN